MAYGAGRSRLCYSFRLRQGYAVTSRRAKVRRGEELDIAGYEGLIVFCKKLDFRMDFLSIGNR